jgi:signal transduction histidine kinase
MRSLSARLLVLTVAFVMLSEVLIFVPSAARFRESYLEARLAAAHLATRALLAAPDEMVTPELEAELLRHVGAVAVMLKRPERRVLMLSADMPPEVAASYDLRDASAAGLIGDALAVLFDRGQRYVRVIGTAPREEHATIEIVIDEGPLRHALRDFSWRILGLSAVISLITAGFVFLSLQLLLVRPMRRITASMVAFRAAPEASRLMPASHRTDEIGIAERELADMQRELRLALTQKTRLAALGAALAKISHDLRNILTTAQLVSDRMVGSTDPTVRRHAPRLVASIDRAITLCARTLQFGRADEPAPQPGRFALAPLVDEVGAMVGLPDGERVAWRNLVPAEFDVNADRDQLFRVLLNLGRNGLQAIAGPGEIRIEAKSRDGRTEILVADSGQGLSPAALAHLFEPFRGASAGGTGLGLAIAQELTQAHGGKIALVNTGSTGTVFRIDLPDA